MHSLSERKQALRRVETMGLGSKIKIEIAPGYRWMVDGEQIPGQVFYLAGEYQALPDTVSPRATFTLDADKAERVPDEELGGKVRLLQYVFETLNSLPEEGYKLTMDWA